MLDKLVMTTLATDGRTLASDGQLTGADLVASLVQQKVFRLADGSVIGYAGELASSLAFHEWITNGMTKETEPELSEAFAAIRINGTSTVTTYDYNCIAIELPAPMCVGSGAQIALGAMLAGKTPLEAVKIAVTRDIYSGGKCRALTVKP
jgi:ATP-dependent protease HslVU (ClpYQ) peptidase subunit